MTEVGTALEQAGRLELPGSLRSLHESGKLTATRLLLDDPGLSYEDFAQIAADLGDLRFAVKRIGDMVQFWAGDLMVNGETLYGDGAYQAFDALGVDTTTLQTWLKVARVVLPDQRREGLSWQHHRMIATRTENPSEQVRLLEAAYDGGMSTRDFADYLRELDDQIAAGDQHLSGNGSDSGRASKPIVIEAVVDAAALCFHQGQRTPDGGAVVPPEPWAQLAAALGEEE